MSLQGRQRPTTNAEVQPKRAYVIRGAPGKPKVDPERTSATETAFPDFQAPHALRTMI